MKMQEEMAERKEKGKKSVGKGRKSPRPGGMGSPLRKKNSKEKIIESSPREKEKGNSPLNKSSGV